MDEYFEKCSFYSKQEDQPHIVDHIFSVDFFVDNSLVIRVEIQIKTDDMVECYIARHPLWSRNCKPFVLYCLQDYLWEVKLIEISSKEVYVWNGGMDDPNKGKVYISIRGEIYDDQYLQNWILPVVNIANTRVFDELEKFYKNNPDCAPSEFYVKSVLNNYYTDLDKNKGIDAENRKLRRDQYQSPNLKLNVFSDEAGDVGFTNVYDSYICTHTIVPEELASDVRNEICDLVD